MSALEYWELDDSNPDSGVEDSPCPENQDKKPAASEEVEKDSPDRIKETPPVEDKFVMPDKEKEEPTAECKEQPVKTPHIVEPKLSKRKKLLDGIKKHRSVIVFTSGLVISSCLITFSVCWRSPPQQVHDPPASSFKPVFEMMKLPKVSSDPVTRDEADRMLDNSARNPPAAVPGAQVKVTGTGKKPQEAKQKTIKAKRRRPGRRRHRRNPKAAVVAAPTRTPRSAGFYRAGVTISGEGEGKKHGRAKIPPGTTFKARLQVGVSTDFPGATVLAEVVSPVESFLPAGTILQGRMRGSGNRIYLDFHSAVLPKGDKVALKGYAVSGSLPGIPAQVRTRNESEGSSRTGSVLSNGSLRTAQGVVGRLGGDSVAGQFARNVAGEGLNEVRTEVNTRAERTLELQAGTAFDVVITG